MGDLFSRSPGSSQAGLASDQMGRCKPADKFILNPLLQ